MGRKQLQWKGGSSNQKEAAAIGGSQQMGSGTASAASAHWVADLHYKAHNHDQIRSAAVLARCRSRRVQLRVVVSVNQGVPFICPGVCVLLVSCFTREGCGSLQAMR